MVDGYAISVLTVMINRNTRPNQAAPAPLCGSGLTLRLHSLSQWPVAADLN